MYMDVYELWRRAVDPGGDRIPRAPRQLGCNLPCPVYRSLCGGFRDGWRRDAVGPACEEANIAKGCCGPGFRGDPHAPRPAPFRSVMWNASRRTPGSMQMEIRSVIGMDTYTGTTTRNCNLDLNLAWTRQQQMATDPGCLGGGGGGWRRPSYSTNKALCWNLVYISMDGPRSRVGRLEDDQELEIASHGPSTEGPKDGNLMESETNGIYAYTYIYLNTCSEECFSRSVARYTSLWLISGWMGQQVCVCIYEVSGRALRVQNLDEYPGTCVQIAVAGDTGTPGPARRLA